MAARRVIALVLTFVACAPTPGKALAEDPYKTAQEQALTLGRVLGGMRRCEGDAWEAPFQDFMAAKRKRGLDSTQTAVIAALVGSAESEAPPEMLECSAQGLSNRATAIQAMRADW
ncbi:MAG TPA: hypothetical protein VGQ35_13090 [Dongiaceae bacterium]|jgi:hypothetical protein|nr:hypothetical protein [Dongiaceae bacterium]